VRIEPVTDPQVVGVARRAAQQEVANQVQQARAAGQLKGVSEEQLLPMVRAAEEQALLKELWASGQAAGWKKHDEQLPLLQGLSRGLQLAMAPVLPLLGDGPGLAVPMLTLTVTALEECEGLRIRTEVVPIPVWQLPLPGGEQLELVLVPAGTYEIGSPEGEDGRDIYTQFRQQCEGVDVEALRRFQLREFALVRHPISRAQWQAVVGGVGKIELDLKEAPGAAMLESLWDRHGQPGEIAIASVSWNQCQEWLRRLNRWLQEQWQPLGGRGEAPQLALPSESQWEAACRGPLDRSGGQASPFHFGETLDRQLGLLRRHHPSLWPRPQGKQAKAALGEWQQRSGEPPGPGGAPWSTPGVVRRSMAPRSGGRCAGGRKCSGGPRPEAGKCSPRTRVQAAARRGVEQHSPQRPRGDADRQPPGRRRRPRRRPPWLFRPPRFPSWHLSPFALGPWLLALPWLLVCWNWRRRRLDFCCGPRRFRWAVNKVLNEGGSPSCCAAGRGTTLPTTPARPCGTATTRTTTTPTSASALAVSPPQHPSP